MSLSQQPHEYPAEAVLADLAVKPDRGLDDGEVSQRRSRYGANVIAARSRRSAAAILADQLRGVVVWLLAAAALLSFVFSDVVDGLAILAVLAINTTIGCLTELKAVGSMAALRRLGKVQSTVRRDGRTMMVPADELVPGDIVLLAAGSIVPADLRLFHVDNLQCDESTLTGESVPVAKSIEPVGAELQPADRSNMAYRGTAVTRGAAEGTVTAIGGATELGRIAALAGAAEPELSRLQRRLDRLGNQLVRLTLALVAAVAVAWLATGRELFVTLETAIALAVAAVPEGLPIVATVALARGMWRMARRNALIERLSAVETLGAVTVIFTDKTGTLTENRMSPARLLLSDGDIEIRPSSDGHKPGFAADGREIDPGGAPHLVRALTIGALCNDAEIGGQGAVADPLETALLQAADLAGLTKPALEQDLPRLRVEPFQAETRSMATIHRDGDRVLIAVKGAPETVIGFCTYYLTADGPAAMTTDATQRWRERASQAAADGLRMLALATRAGADDHQPVYEGLTLIGLIGLLDPPRPGVAEAIAQCRAAGIRVVMLTGDHVETAGRIARDVGIADSESDGDDVFARITPADKLDLVQRFQTDGEIVAMTGDGVNDAPALRQADIGIAMGKRGTDVAREAAAMVLRDDSFATIVAAIAQGRVIFANIRRFVVYLLSCNLSEILVLGFATLVGLAQPLLPLQILFLNLVTDVFPAFALGMGEGDSTVMNRPPRNPQEPILSRRQWLTIGLHGLSITVATIAAFWLAIDWLHFGDAEAVTVAFLTLALAQLWHVFNMRGLADGLLVNSVTRNPYVWGALALCLLILVVAVKLPFLAEILALVELDSRGMTLVLVASIVPLVLGQIASLWPAARR